MSKKQSKHETDNTKKVQKSAKFIKVQAMKKRKDEIKQ